MKIIGLDIATMSGVAVGGSGEIPKSWPVDLGRGLSEDYRFSQTLKLTHGLIGKYKPDLIAVEAAIGGPMASALLIGLVACVRGCAANSGVKVEAVRLASVRKHFLGKNPTVKQFPHLKPAAAKKAIKGLVIDRCNLLGWDVEDDNAADACAVWDYAQATFGRKYQSAPHGGLFK